VRHTASTFMLDFTGGLPRVTAVVQPEYQQLVRKLSEAGFKFPNSPVRIIQKSS
jgi:hypothetical protein